MNDHIWSKVSTGTKMMVLVTFLLSGCAAAPTDVPRDDPTKLPTVRKTITIGTGAIQRGFNPHITGQNSETTAVLANLTLPSAFIRVPTEDSDSPEGWRQNTDLITAVHLSEDGRTITYDIHRDAQWSSNPTWQVDARDFQFLRSVMTKYPGIGDTSGYDLITNVSSENRGKRVVVTLSRRYAGWRGLFRHLLPRFILEGGNLDELETLDNRIPSSGGPGNVTNLDVDRGEIVVGVNDKFTGQGRLASDGIVFRRLDTDEEIPDAFRSQSIQGAFVKGNSVTPQLYQGIPGLKLHHALRARVLNVDINAASPFLGGKPHLAAVVLGSINTVRAAETAMNVTMNGHSNEASRVVVPDSVTVAPSARVKPPVVDTPLQPHVVDPLTAFKAEGISINRDNKVLQKKALEGGKLSRPLIIGVVSSDRIARVAATSIADDLSRRGLPTLVYKTSDLTLNGQLLPQGAVDLVVGWSDLGRGIVDTVAARYGCHSSDANRAIRRSRTRDQQELPSQDLSREAAVTVGVVTGARAGNVSGLCDRELDTLITRLRQRYETETDPREREAVLRELLPAIEIRVRKLHVTLPILQETAIEAIGSSAVIPEDPTKPLGTGLSPVESVFADLRSWR